MSTATMIDQPKSIPTPADFPVSWANPEEAGFFWEYDKMHFPAPQTPLESALWAKAHDGLQEAFGAYDVPLRILFRDINTYIYTAFIPQIHPPEEMAALEKRTEEKIGAAIAQLGELWEGEWLPEIKEHLDFWESFDLGQAPLAALIEHFDETLARHQRLWGIHFLVGLPMMLPLTLFAELYQDIFPDQSEFDAYQLLEGFSNKTVESGQLLWALSRKALVSPEVTAALAETQTKDVLTSLNASEAGAAFLAELNAYLQEYGRRGNNWGFVYPSWLEDPTPVLNHLRDYLTQPNRDLAQEMADIVERREQKIAEARAKLQGYPQPVVEQFEFLLKAAQIGNVLSEDHGYWIDFRAAYQVRCVLLELGRRLVQCNVIETQDDIFFLNLAEIREALSQHNNNGQEYNNINWQARIVASKAELAHWAKITPPDALGVPPVGPPPDNPIARTIMKFQGAPPPISENRDEIWGNAGSPGTIKGIARVINALAEAEKLHAGDILVTASTAPPWTPLFATAAAVVTDTGGILSHCAVVAREYGIPAVVGTQIATTTIQDGQMIEVDGNRGLVCILSQPANGHHH